MRDRSMFRQYAQLTRAHTAPLEAVPAVVGVALAQPSGDILLLASWGIFGVLYHLTGYGMNSLVDWQAGFDKEDPHKQHHPLNSGGLCLEQARWMIGLTGLVTAVVTLLLILNEMSVLGLVAASIMVAAGLAYNWLSKQLQAKFLPIAVAHSFVVVTPYVTLGGTVHSLLFLSVVAYVFLWVTFQIGVSGEVKDIQRDEENFLKTLGSSADEHRIIFSRNTLLFSYGIKTLSVLCALFIALLSGITLEYGILLFCAGILSLYTTQSLISSGEYIYHQRMTDMALIELLAIMMLVMAIAPFLSGNLEIILGIGSVLWVICFNLIEWGTIIAPHV